MKNKICFIVLLFAGLFISLTSVKAEPLLSSPYVITTNENDEVSKAIPLNLVNLQYVGENMKEDVFLNNSATSILNFSAKKNDVLRIRNMGIYKKEKLDVVVRFLESVQNVTISLDGALTIRDRTREGAVNLISMDVYKSNTNSPYPDLYAGYSEHLEPRTAGKYLGDLFGYQNLYGIYLPKKINDTLRNVDVTKHDGVLDWRYKTANVTGGELSVVYPVFKTGVSGFSRGTYFLYPQGTFNDIRLFDAASPAPIPLPYEETISLTNEQKVTDITSIDVNYTVTQKLANYATSSHFPTDQTFKITTNFERTSIEDFPVEIVVKSADNQVIDPKYYNSTSVKNNHEITFSTNFLKDYKTSIITVEYKQHLDGKKINLLDFYNLNEQAFIFPYNSRNEWERRGQHFKQEEPSKGETKLNFSIKIDATILNGGKVVQNKSTDDYNVLDFISDLTSNLPGDSVSASFTKKVVFQNIGEQNIYITLKSSLSSVTKDILLKVVVIEGTLHFTEVPSELSFPPIALTGKMIDYEVSSFNKGSLSVADARLTSSPWSLTATLTENKATNDFGDILYFRNDEGAVYNITNQTQNVMTNRNLEPTKTIIDYEKNKKIGLFIRINPLLVKKGAYNGLVTWSLVDAPG